MSSDLDKLVEAITDLVLSELSEKAPVTPEVPLPIKKAAEDEGKPVLICPCGESVEPEFWASAQSVKSVSLRLVLPDGVSSPPACASWPRWTFKATTNQLGQSRAVLLAGADLPTLGGLANLGAVGGLGARLGIAAISSGIPLFVHDQHFEHLRRHSSRLASGFVRRFEELYRVVASFGVEFGGAAAAADFLRKAAGASGQGAIAARGSGRDVVTVEDVEAVRRAGDLVLKVSIGTIVTPLAAQRASEWGIEVKYQ